jgi:hypothetical protein
MKSYQFEVFDAKDQYGMSMPALSFEATSWREAYETALEALGARIQRVEGGNDQ